jgi:hypothetical protein
VSEAIDPVEHGPAVRVLRSALVAVAVVGATFVLLVLAVPTFVPPWLGDRLWWAIGVSLALSLLAVHWRWRLSEKYRVLPYVRLEVAPTGTDSDDRAAFVQAARDAFVRLCSEQFTDPTVVLTELLQDVLDPGRRGDRVTKRVTLTETHLLLRTARTLSIGPDGALIPVLKPQKRTLRDDLSCELDEGPVATLTRMESHGATIELIDLLVRVTFREALVEGELSSLTATLVGGVARDSPLDDDGLRRLEKTVEIVGRVHEDKTDRDGLTRLMALLAFASTYYCLIAIVPRASDGRTSRRKLVAEYRERLPKSPHSRIDYLRRTVGLTPRQVWLLVPEALDSSSVHVHCPAPPGMYTFKAVPHVLTGGGSSAGDRIDGQRTQRPYARVGNTWGLDYVHAYFRDLQQPLRSSPDRGTPHAYPMVQVEFREKPPGLLLPLAVTSLYLAALVGIAGRNYDALFNQGSNSGVAALFGVPAILAGWMVTRIDMGVLSRISIPTALLVVWFVTNAGVALANVAAKPIREAPAMNLTHSGWMILSVTCFAHLVTVVYMYLNRTIRYQRRLSDSGAIR